MFFLFREGIIKLSFRRVLKLEDVFYGINSVFYFVPLCVDSIYVFYVYFCMWGEHRSLCFCKYLDPLIVLTSLGRSKYLNLL